ncbi:MAG: hypothetical protein LBU39_04520 [Desulfobulbaceae bacterium]|nr:hypothetical protein [Desulfobulbaceae bacterium]
MPEPDRFASFTRARHSLREYAPAASRLAVAFSGGVDSAVLLHLAIEELGGENVVALHARSALGPGGRHRRMCERMLADFSRLCAVRLVDFAPLAISGFAANPPERCYLCKKALYTEFLRLARQDGASTLADGANADDAVDERPGWRAIQELAVVTPLRQAAIGKTVIRQYARLHGLANHDLPAQSCLATRFAPGLAIDEAALALAARLESRLGDGLLTDFRLRLTIEGCGLEVRGAQAENPASIDEAAIRRCFHEHGLALAWLSLAGERI